MKFPLPYFVLLLFFASPGMLLAQLHSMPELSVEEFATGASPTFTPSASAEYDFTDSRNFNDDGDSIQQHLLLLRTPIFSRRVGERTRINIGLRYESSMLGSGSPFFEGQQQLHEIELPVTLLGYNHDQTWAWLVRGAGIVGTDFSSLNGDAYGGSLVAVAGRRIGDNFALGFGFYYSHRFGDDFFVPGIGFSWLPHDDWAIGLVPPRASIFYTPSDNWRFGLQARLRAGSWLVSSDEYGDNTRLSYSAIHTYASAEYRIRESNLWFGARAGAIFGENWQAEQANGFTAFDENADTAFFIGITLRYHAF